VLIQTDFPTIRSTPRSRATTSTASRRGRSTSGALAGFPPFSHLALLRAESKKPGEAPSFLARGRAHRPRIAAGRGVRPVPAPLERKAGFERAQLLVRAATRRAAALPARLARGLAERGGPPVRWSLDVDPQEV
jgi:primosomal protein N' (replication factor Y)